jgi:hypothetical protein
MFAATYANYSPDWWTPGAWWDWVRASFGTDDVFDPCPGTWQPGDPSGLEIHWQWPAYVNHPGSRGSAQKWWSVAQLQTWTRCRCRVTAVPPNYTKRCKECGERLMGRPLEQSPLIWCAFSVEQLRHMRPSPLEIPGTLVAPRERVAFLWGGDSGRPEKGGAMRIHGAPMRSPGNWTVFWASAGVEVATPPVESIVVPTGRGSR